MIFPILTINNGKITSLKGEVSYLYKIKHEDLTQKSYEEVAQFYESFHQELKTFREEYFYKFYYIKDVAYLNTNDPNITTLNLGLEFVEFPLSILFKEHDVYRDIEIFDDYLIIGHRFVRLLNVYDLPSSITPNFLEEYEDLVFHLRKFDSVKAKKKFDLKRKLHFSLSQESLRNIESEKAFRENENLLEDVMTGEEIVFSFEGWLTVNSDSLMDLNQKTIELYQKAKLHGLRLLGEGRGLAYFFSSIIPGVAPTMKREHLVPARFVTGLMPFPHEYLFDSGFEVHSKSGRTLNIDLFHQENHNFNVLITGTSGQGKSVIANNILFEEIKNGGKAVVLDLGNSFKKTTEYLGGVSLPRSFNPLQFTDPTYLKSFVLSVVEPSFFGPTDEGKLFELISEMNFDVINSINKFIDSLEVCFPNIKYFFRELQSHFSDDHYEMPDLLYCDLTLYPDKIKAPLIIYLIEHFKNLTGRRVFIFDECWNLLLNQASFIAESFRTFRKHNASAIAISQNLEDFLSTQLGRVIYQTTYFKFVFRQDTNAEFFTPFQKELLESVVSRKRKYSEFLLLTDFHQKVCRFYPSSFLLQLFNSDKSEVEVFNAFREEREGILDFKEIFHQFLMLKTGERSCESY